MEEPKLLSPGIKKSGLIFLVSFSVPGCLGGLIVTANSVLIGLIAGIALIILFAVKESKKRRLYKYKSFIVNLIGGLLTGFSAGFAWTRSMGDFLAYLFILVAMTVGCVIIPKIDEKLSKDFLIAL